jgi:DNA-directed RNA polymerase specialized sigma24 family protein
VTAPTPNPGPDDRDVLFRALFAQHFGRLRQLARLLGAADADDVAHEAFLRLHRSRDPLSEHVRAAGRLRATVVRLARKQRARGTGAELDALPRRQREVLVLRYGLGLGTADIAATLGRSPDTVEAVLRRGLAKLHRETRARPPVRRPSRRVVLVAAPLVTALVVSTSVFAATQLTTPDPPLAAPYRADSTLSRSASSGGDSTSKATSSIPTTNTTTS